MEYLYKNKAVTFYLKFVTAFYNFRFFYKHNL